MSERSVSGARSLEARYYVSAEIFALETERIFRRDWLCVGRDDDTPEPGDYRTCEIEGEPLLLLRGDDGDVRGFANVCRHRGAVLCEKPRGRIPRALICPYHAWSYDRSGRLLAAPTMRSDQLDTSALGLARVAAQSWQGFLFVNLSAHPRGLVETYAPMETRLAPWSLERLVEAHRLEYDVAANWKLLFQNYSECYHCPSVHPALSRMSASDSAANDILSGLFLGGPMQLEDGVDSMTTSRAACGSLFPGLSAIERRRVYYYTCFPTMFVSPHPDFVLVHRLHRIAVDRTHVVCQFLFSPEDVGEPSFDPRPAVEFWDLTNRQDWAVCESVQKGMASSRYEPGPYSDWESVLVEFDRHYLDALGRG